MPYAITPLLVGIRNVDQGIMTYQREYGKRIWLPMWGFLLQGEGKNIIVDTGLDDFMTPPEFTEETGLVPVYMEDALASVNLAPENIDIVINTHLHDDHSGNNLLFPDAKFYIQSIEVDCCRNPHPLDYRYEPEFIEGLDIQSVDGDMTVLPGLDLILTPGHTPGCQTVRVETEKGPAVIPGMCCHNDNFPSGRPAVCPGVHSNAFEAYDTAQKIKQMGGIRLPLHELAVAEIKL
jgi:N-acyl homoserine lactone hydrolase